MKIQNKMESNNNKKTLSEVATVLTENQFWKLADKDPNILKTSIVAVLPFLERGCRCAEDWTGGLPAGNVAITSDVLSPQYIAFLLNTAPCQVDLFGGNINVKTKVAINKKKISSLEIPVLSEEDQHLYCVAEALFSSAYDMMLENREEEKYMYVYRVMENLCNSLAIDLYAHSFFLEKGIKLYEHWKEVVENSDDTQDLKIVMDAIVGKDSPLRNDIMKMQIVFEK